MQAETGDDYVYAGSGKWEWVAVVQLNVVSVRGG